MSIFPCIAPPPSLKLPRCFTACQYPVIRLNHVGGGVGTVIVVFAKSSLYTYSEGSQYFRLHNHDSRNGESVFPSSPVHSISVSCFPTSPPLALSTPAKSSYGQSSTSTAFSPGPGSTKLRTGCVSYPSHILGKRDWFINQSIAVFLSLLSTVRPFLSLLLSLFLLSCVARSDAPCLPSSIQLGLVLYTYSLEPTLSSLRSAAKYQLI